jgi:hypothetical protein
MGADLNATLDNLWFTLLMKRPALRTRCRADKDEAIVDSHEALSVFEMAMTEGIRGNPSAQEKHTVENAFREHERGEVTFSEVLSIFGSERPEGYGFWGFKEPCAAMWIRELAQFFPGLGYIHVIRDQRDMAMSHTMRREMRHWGSQYGISGSETTAGLMRFWEEVNSEAANGAVHLGDRFLLIQFEDLCSNPDPYISKIASMAGVEATKQMLFDSSCFVMQPSTIGRGSHIGVSAQ